MANNVNQPAFRPDPAATVDIAATSVSASVKLQTGYLNRHVRMFNAGAQTVFVEFGESTVAATLPAGGTAGSMPVAPGDVEIVSAPTEYVAAITATGTATIYFTPGEGM